jgi:hypothetical protein
MRNRSRTHRWVRWNLTRVALGHSSVSVTQRYLRDDQSDVDAAILALDTACVA